MIRVAIAESSVIVRGGLTAAFKRLSAIKIQPIEVLSKEALQDCLRMQLPDMLVVNPTFGDYFDVARFKEEMGDQDGERGILPMYCDGSLACQIPMDICAMSYRRCCTIRK